MEPPMTVKELSDYLRLDRMTIYKMLKEGTLPASRIGHQWRFLRDDVDEWIRSRRVSPQISVLVIDAEPEVGQFLEAELSTETVETVMITSDDDVMNQISRRVYQYVFLQLSGRTLDVFREIRQMNSTLPVVILANGSDGELVDEAIGIGTFTFVKKPGSAEEARKIIDSIKVKKTSEDR